MHTGIEVIKAAPYLLPKGVRGQEHGVRKAKRDKYLSRVGQLGRAWSGLNCPNPSDPGLCHTVLEGIWSGLRHICTGDGLFLVGDSVAYVTRV